MKVTRGYKTELDLNNKQLTLCLKHAGAARWAYNWGLRRYQEEYQAGRKTPHAISLHKELNILKRTEIPWMYDVSKCAAQEALRDLEKAFKRFFENCHKKKAGTFKGKVGYPRFKSKKRGIGSFRLTGSIHVYEKSIKLPRLGVLRLKEKNYLPTSRVHILSATVSEKAGRWFVSLQVEQEIADPVKAIGPIIGVDLGIKTLAMLSNGKPFENPKALSKNLKKLRRLSRRHSRKKRDGKNREKSRRNLARLHAHIATIRQDAIHKTTSAIVAKTKHESERYSRIGIEDLNVKGMMKNRKLSRVVGDVGMHEFKRQITYKAKQSGSLITEVNRWEPTSKICSCCEWVNEELTLKDRVFVCIECGYVADRDYNAAKNIAKLA